MTGLDDISRCRGALYGLYMGDALAMPIHWYYDRHALQRDYGRVTDYVAPRNPHPDSILWRSDYTPPNEKGEILHDQARYWGRRGVHYHQFLKAGENTLNLKLCTQLIHSLNAVGAYSRKDHIKRYITFMTTPGMHRDTYVEECHRHFFARYAQGIAPEKAGVVEKHIGGLIGAVPIALFYREDQDRARSAAHRCLSLTHPGDRMAAAAHLLLDLLLETLHGMPLLHVLHQAIGRQQSPFLAHPFQKWLELPDEVVIGRLLSPACYVEDAVPAVVYLALKYHGDPETALVSNTNLGGDNAHRGAILGALLGAENGLAAFPGSWLNGLLEPPPDLVGC